MDTITTNVNGKKLVFHAYLNKYNSDEFYITLEKDESEMYDDNDTTETRLVYIKRDGRGTHKQEMEYITAYIKAVKETGKKWIGR